MNNNEEYLAKIAPDIGKAAGVLARQFPSLEYDDIYQELWVYVLERKKELKTHEENGRPVDFLVKAGQQRCGKEIATRTPRNDLYWYTANVVRKMLDAGMLYFTDAGEPAGRSDLTEAYRALDDEGRRIVAEACLERRPEYRKPGAHAMRATRAIQRLADEMNRISEGRSDWHIEREISGYIGSRKTINQSPAEY